MGEAGLIGDPDLIGIIIFARHYPLDLVIAHIEGNIGPFASMGVDARHRAQLPDASLKAEIGAGERAYWADIGGITAKLAVEARLTLRDNLPMAATVIEAKHWVTC